jgi:hypothetical protein
MNSNHGPNIKYIGRAEHDRAKRKVLKANGPIESVNVGGGTIELPDADFQINKRLFYHSDARRIARLFPHLYKIVVPKSKRS